MTSRVDISIIIPFLNEEENIPELGSALLEFSKATPSVNYEIILVNDGSVDNSIKVLKSATFPRGTKVINLAQNFGSHAALRAGIQLAAGDFITFIYADLQDPLYLISEMYSVASKDNKDIVWATRKRTGTRGAEKWLSGLYAGLMKKFVSKKFPPNGFDIVLFNKKVTRELNRNIENNSSIFLQILTLGFAQATIEYDKVPRKGGKSKWTFSKKMKLLIDSFVGFSYAPIRLVSIIGMVMFFSGVMWSAYIIARKLISNDLASGWTMLVSILLLGFGVTNIALGVIAEYLWRTLDASRKRPAFIIDDIIELDSE
jgi:glycosyltransferase involved in cell wall biosynthesis